MFVSLLFRVVWVVLSRDFFHARIFGCVECDYVCVVV